jgi:hypothetical protein
MSDCNSIRREGLNPLRRGSLVRNLCKRCFHDLGGPRVGVREWCRVGDARGGGISGTVYHGGVGSPGGILEPGVSALFKF